MSDYIPTPGGPFDPNRDHNRYDNLNYAAPAARQAFMSSSACWS